jgi:hypothetical protein
MNIPGKRVPQTRWIHTTEYVVAVEVEMVIPVDDPTEPCLEPETIKHLREVKERAEKGDVDWLLKHGRVYAALKEVA